MSCTRSAGSVTCQLPSTTSSLRVSAGNSDDDEWTDLALLKPSTGTPGPGAYWLRNQCDGGFSLHQIGATSAATSGKIVVLSAPSQGKRDAVAIWLTGDRLFAWSPAADGGTTAVLNNMNNVDDIARARLPGWVEDGLVSTRYNNPGAGDSTVIAWPEIAHGSAASGTFNSLGGERWEQVVGWRDWLSLTTFGQFGSKVVAPFLPDGGRESTPNLAGAIWAEATELDLFGDGVTQLFMKTSSLSYTLLEFPAGPIPMSVPGPLTLRRPDGGNLLAGTTFVVGPYGALGAGVSLFTLMSSGGVRQYTNLRKVGTSWVADEVSGANVPDAGVFVQGSLGDLNHDGAIDLVLVDSAGLVSIHYAP